jgi:hypothetical protein
LIPALVQLLAENRRDWNNDNGGFTKMPERYRVRYARNAEEVLSELQKFVEYVKSGPVIAILPKALQDISSHDADDVAKWQRQIEHVRRKTCPMGAIVGFWLDLLAEMFTGARHRLDELGAAHQHAASPLVHGKSSVTPRQIHL